ncbi:JAB domain-containing protein [Stieleria mannarensis]|uniref:JAB domain-containing protein n=1 Tax=Stieleria mannarensis TaxID=2755585 RepID=UPI001600489E|nr:JAB domain-containing protein [Rhodopirellula sp. JC639]
MLMQQFFEFEAAEFDSRERDLATAGLSPGSEVDASLYGSVKRVSLIYERPLNGRPCLTSTIESREFFRQYWKDNPAWDQEQFVVACLDTKHRVQCVVRVTVGTLDASLVHPREVFKPAIIEGSSAVILSHNHPSGNTTPSREDVEVTDRLTDAGKLLGITVLDHIIHGDGTGEVLSIRESR